MKRDAAGIDLAFRLAHGLGLACRSIEIEHERGTVMKTAIGSSVVGALFLTLACHAWAGKSPMARRGWSRI